MIGHGPEQRLLLNPQLLEEYVIATAIEMKRLKRERQEDISFNLVLIAFLVGVLVCAFGYIAGSALH